MRDPRTLSNPLIERVIVSGAAPDLTRKTAMLVVSRMPHRLDSQAAWLSSVRESIRELAAAGVVLVASVEGIWWEYPAWFAARTAVPVLLILPPVLDPEHVDTDTIITRLNLSAGQTTFVIPILKQPLEKEEVLHLRDTLCWHTADTRYPIALRPGGYWQSVISCEETVDRRYSTSYPKQLPL
jgi:hypothetical protein